MDKKQYLIKLLDSLSDTWSLAKWFKIILEKWDINDDIVDMLMEALQWAIHTAKSNISSDKLQKWIEFLQQMKEMEIKQKQQDDEDIKKLDELLKQF